MSLIDILPEVRGRLKANVSLAPYSWLRVGGAAEVFFIPKDEADLALFLSSTPKHVPIHILGVASNTLIRDGGVPGVTIRLGAEFSKITIEGTQLRAGAAALDAKVAQSAAKAGLAGVEFLVGIPGTIGGALRMNAGCYGRETQDVLLEAVALDRQGRRQIMKLEEFGYSYRHSRAPSDLIFTEARMQCQLDAPESIEARLEDIRSRRENSQPIREKTGGSTFKNPDPDMSGGRSAWQLIDAVGGRGLEIGGAKMNEKHCNFMINTGEATAADLETLGETIRDRVKSQEGVDLEWEIRRIGNKI